MKVSGKQTCSYCGKEYSWEYLIPQHISDTPYLDVEIVTPGIVHCSRINSKSERIFKLKAICPKCLQDDTFDYYPEDKSPR